MSKPGLPLISSDSDIEALFKEPKSKKDKRKINPELKQKKQPIKDIIEPFGLDETDPKFRKLRKKSIKVLTIPKRRLIIRRTIKRKDDEVVTRAKTETNYMQIGAVALLAGGAILGATTLLGGGLTASIVATILVACLFIMAFDYRK